MYSVVLMMALTSGGDVPALGHGGCGGGYGGCYGGCYGGYSGACYGGGHHGRRGGCHGGGHGSCYGSCYGGCYGGYSGSCYGGGHHRKHRGGCGCCGGNYAGCWGGCGGGWGGCYGGGCYGGCYGGFGGCYGGAMTGGMGAPIMTAPVNPAPATNPSTTTPSGKNKTSIESAAPATLIVSVPANTRLTIDGEATTSTTAQRVFVTPALNFGREYHYTLEAEYQKDGQTVKVSKEVAVKAGAQTRVSFNAENTADVASR